MPLEPQSTFPATPEGAAVAGMFAALDRSDPDGASRYFAEDARFVAGNNPAIIGREAFRVSALHFSELVAGTRHAPLQIWALPPCPSSGRTVLICEMTVEYTKHDGETISVPSCNVFELAGEEIVACRGYMDLSPVFG